MSSTVNGPLWAGAGLRAAAVCLLPATAPAAVPPSYDVTLDGEGSARHSFPVEEGTYRVTVEITGERRRTVAVLAEQRRWMREGVVLQGKRPVSTTFIVDVRRPGLDPLPDNAPGGTRVSLKPREIGSASWDEQLTVEVTAPAVLRRIRAEPVELPTLYLAGDSTVTDQPAAPSASWGQLLTRYFRDDIAVANHAESGESLKSFVTGLRFDKLLSRLRAGDWVMIQFGHNDQKIQWPQTYAEAGTTYRAWLRTYIAEVRRRGATPILVTSPERRNFDTDGRIRPTLADYAEAMRAVAREQQVALLDLNAASVRIYEALGPSIAPGGFADNGNDKTHHNEYGARLLARAVIEAVRTSDLTLTRGLADHIAADAGVFDAAKPPLP
jgi:lysophospholipase L1-like esterase